MRSTTLAASRDMVLPDSADSAAATVMISAPHIEKMTVVTPVNTTGYPSGAKPPCEVRLLKPGLACEPMPRSHAASTTMKTTMAATLIDANQNSNSPYERADVRFTSVSTTMSPRPICQTSNIGIHPCTIFAPAMASMPTTMTQKYQYNQPLMKP